MFRECVYSGYFVCGFLYFFLLHGAAKSSFVWDRFVVGVVSEFGKYRTLSRWHCCLARKRSFLRSRRENAGRASAGLVRPILENRSRIEPPRLPGFENSRNAASSSRRHAQSRAAA